MNINEKAQRLAETDVFGSAGRASLRQVAEHSLIEILEPGGNLQQSGVPPSSVCVVLAGTADVYRSGEFVATLHEGDIVGEIAMITGAPGKATIRANAPVEIVALSREALKDAVDNVPGFGWRLLELFAQLNEFEST